MKTNNANHKLSINELTKIFPHPSKPNTNIPIFANVSLNMDAKRLNFLIGPSGSGKTTLFRILLKIEVINAGEIHFDNQVIHYLSHKLRTKYLQSVGFMDQFPARYLSMRLTVKENLDYVLLLRSTLNSNERQERIQSIVKELNITNLLEQKVQTLSGGELRRLGLACTIISKPTLLLLDEPTAQLDAENKKLVMNTINQLYSIYKPLIIITTHDQSIIEEKSAVYEIKNRRIELL